MEYKNTIFDPRNTRNITAVCVNTDKKELVTGNEDAVIACWNLESGAVSTTMMDHKGHITGLFYYSEVKVLISSSLDASIKVWTTNGKLVQTIEVGSPVYCMQFLKAKGYLVVGLVDSIRLYHVHTFEDAVPVENLIVNLPIKSKCHQDIVKCILSVEGRLFSSGFDRRLVIHTLPGSNDKKLQIYKSVNNAHDGAVTAITYFSRVDSSFILTGSYDKMLKLWTLEGDPIAKWSGYTSTISSLNFFPHIDGIVVSEVSGNTTTIDPRTGVDISKYIGNPFSKHTIKWLASCDNILLAVTRRSVIQVVYNFYAPFSTISVESALSGVTVSDQWIFTAGHELLQWETNPTHPSWLTYAVIQKPAERKKRAQLPSTYTRNAVTRQKQQVALHKLISQDIRRWEGIWSKQYDEKWKGNVTKQIALMEDTTKKTYEQRERRVALIAKKMGMEVSPGGEQGDGQDDDDSLIKDDHEVSAVSFYEPLQLLAVGMSNGEVRIFKEERATYKKDGNQVDAKIAGLKCFKIIHRHKEGVISMECFENDGEHWMITGGYDRKLVIWNLEKLTVHLEYTGDARKFTESGLSPWVPVSDGAIRNISFCNELRAFCYSSDDGNAYLRRFIVRPDPNEAVIPLLAVMQGHKISCASVLWLNSDYVRRGEGTDEDLFEETIFELEGFWITFGFDEYLKVWSADGLTCLVSERLGEGIFCAKLDPSSAQVLVGGHHGSLKTFKVELACKKNQPAAYCLVKGPEYRGHNSAITGIEITFKAYITTSLDGTLRLWNAPHDRQTYVANGVMRRKRARSTRLPLAAFPQRQPPLPEGRLKTHINANKEKLTAKVNGLVDGQPRNSEYADWNQIESDMEKTLERLDKSLKAL